MLISLNMIESFVIEGGSYYKTKMEKSMNNCKACGKEIPTKRNRDREKNFCDRGCVARFFHPKPAIIACEHCGIMFQPKWKQKFCCRKCLFESKRSKYVKTCPVCEKKFTLKNKAYEKRGGGIFCSRECGTISNKKYNCNYNFFENIDTQEKAYWLGFLFADGYHNGKEVVINLKASDGEHLEKFKNNIESNHPITYGIDKTKYQKASFRISSKKMCSDLDSHGCIRRKSLVLQYPKHIPPHLERHFVRGYFDGDGYVSKSIKNKAVVFYSGSQNFVDGLCLAISKYNISMNKGIKNARFLKTGKKSEIEKLYHFLYDDASVFLERKMTRFLIHIPS